MVKAILFDIDNTLMDYMEMKYRCCVEAIDAMISAGLKINKKKALKSLYELYDELGMDYGTIFQKLLLKEKGKVDYRILAHGVVTYRNFKENYLVPYPNVTPTLLKLSKKYRLAIVSDAPIMQAWMRLVTMKLDDFFEVVITKGDVKRQKNTATPFRVALRKLNLNPEDVVMVGDRIERDIKTPKKLKIKTIYARYGDTNPPEKGLSSADYEINDFNELPKILEKIEKIIL
ncbi:MAG: HAD-IA family hydrolase [archaeon]